MAGTGLRLRLRPGALQGAPKLLSEGGKAEHDGGETLLSAR
jgi:hypothetical protein